MKFFFQDTWAERTRFSDNIFGFKAFVGRTEKEREGGGGGAQRERQRKRERGREREAERERERERERLILLTQGHSPFQWGEVHFQGNSYRIFYI